MKDIVVWLIHMPAGTIGLASAMVALSASKGSAVHRKAGIYFTISMLIMLFSGFIAALIKQSTVDMFLSAVVFYTVFTAWLTTHHKKNEIGFLEQAALVWILFIAIAGLFMEYGWHDAGATSPYLFWAGFAIFCAIGDARNLYRAGLSGIQRVLRHVWRIGFSLIWAALALTDKIVKIQGSDIQALPQDQMLFVMAVPTIIILIIFLYWIINILFFSRQRFASYGDQIN
jgi:hypothetical protein